MNWNLVKLSCTGVFALTLAAVPALASPGAANGLTNQAVGASRDQVGMQYAGLHAGQGLAGLKGPKYGRDGWANVENGPYRNPYARNYYGNRG